ncbi:class II fructose-bisphosphate aldolase [Streptobacillus felis]|uniref:Class II fructose-bisphosphate aldolase n=2 Tax=Streptobacillus felis TaxID=1384509 RepID=A0A7Z0PEU8_9FUSO|nr:class II fructose-bisphosphate aldolase [Streptobacillus felis]
MLINPKFAFEKAMNYNFAIPSTNFIDAMTLCAYLEVAEEEKLPIIISIAESHIQYIDFDDAVLLAKYYINKYNVKAILHLDHGQSFDLIKKAIDSGFNSVMIDASSKPFEENVRITKEIVDYAHERGVFVESEIGHVGSGDLVGLSCSADDDNIYTTVEEALEFAKLTNTDSLAISIGTVHGNYIGEPKINFERLREIREKLSIPLVLHGGSSSGDENLNRCAKEGIDKINIYTDFIVAGQKATSSEVDYHENKKNVKNAIKDKLRHYFKVFETKEV